MIKIKKKTVESVGVLTLEGKLSGIDCTGSLQERIKEFTKNKIKHFVLDLSEVTWIDSTGLGELIATLSSVQKEGGNLVLAKIPFPVQSLLKMTNLTQVFETYEDVDEALAAFDKKK